MKTPSPCKKRNDITKTLRFRLLPCDAPTPSSRSSIYRPRPPPHFHCITHTNTTTATAQHTFYVARRLPPPRNHPFVCVCHIQLQSCALFSLHIEWKEGRVTKPQRPWLQGGYANALALGKSKQTKEDVTFPFTTGGGTVPKKLTRVAAPSPRASLGRRTVCGRTEQLSAAGFEALRN